MMQPDRNPARGRYDDGKNDKSEEFYAVHGSFHRTDERKVWRIYSAGGRRLWRRLRSCRKTAIQPPVAITMGRITNAKSWIPVMGSARSGYALPPNVVRRRPPAKSPLRQRVSAHLHRCRIRHRRTTQPLARTRRAQAKRSRLCPARSPAALSAHFRLET